MPGTPRTRMIEVALRCYPRRWRDHHGDEAIEIAQLLVSDGVPALFVVGSYLKGAARERLITRPSRRLLPAVGALLVGASLIGVPLVLLDSSTPASAASGNEVVAMISSHQHAVEQLESVLSCTTSKSASWGYRHLQAGMARSWPSTSRCGMARLAPYVRYQVHVSLEPRDALTGSLCRCTTPGGRRSSLDLARSPARQLPSRRMGD